MSGNFWCGSNDGLFFDRAIIFSPRLHHAENEDRNQFDIRQFGIIASQPDRVVAKLDLGTLDDAGALRAIIALNAVFPTSKTIVDEIRRVFLYNIV